MTHVFLQAAEATSAGPELPFAPIYYGVITMGIGLALLALLWSFRNTLLQDPVEHHGEEGADAADSGSTAPQRQQGSYH